MTVGAIKMKLINIKEYNVAPQDYFAWCRQNKIPVMRVSLLKYRLADADFMIFKLKFAKDENYSDSRYDDF